MMKDPTKIRLINPGQVLDLQRMRGSVKIGREEFEARLLLLARLSKRPSTAGCAIKCLGSPVVEVDVILSMIILFVAKHVDG